MLLTTRIVVWFHSFKSLLAAGGGALPVGHRLLWRRRSWGWMPIRFSEKEEELHTA